MIGNPSSGPFPSGGSAMGGAARKTAATGQLARERRPRGPSPRRLPLFLAALAIFAALSSSPSTAEDWTVLETGRSPAEAVRLRVSRPSSWRPNVMDSELEVSRGFFHSGENPFLLQRGLIVTGTVFPGEVGPPYDLAEASRLELSQIADVIAGNVSRMRDLVSKKIYAYEIVRIYNTKALKIFFENIYKINSKSLFNILEIISVPYASNYKGQKVQANIVLHCTYTGLLVDKNKIIEKFHQQRDEFCGRFFDSLAILDKAT